MNDSPLPQSDFRPDIQGLRALAVLFVLLYHIWPEFLPGGFAGVDVFFVISGFIITRLLFREHAETGSIRLASFWARRIRRLLPAATLVLGASLAATLLWLPRNLWEKAAAQVLASALYVQNWWLAAQAVDYAGQREAATLVQHYWSLSIEEQFYLVWPIFFAAAAAVASRFKVRPHTSIALLCLCIFAASFSAAVLYPDRSSYFATSSRAWELALGCFLASLPAERLPVWLRAAASWAGLGMILWAGLFLKGTGGYPGWTALVPTLGAFLMIAAGNAGNWSWFPVLNWGPIRFVGDISYSLYLWHWPLIVVWRGDWMPLPISNSAAILIASLVLAILTRFCVENPLRIHRSRPLVLWRSYLMGAVLVASVAGGAGCVIHYQAAEAKEAVAEFQRSPVNDPNYPGASALDPDSPAPAPGGPIKPNPVFAKDDLPSLYLDGCEARQTSEASICEYGDANGITIALIGDSHAAQYLPALELLARNYRWRLIVLQKAACLIHPMSIRFRSTGLPKSECDSWKKSALKLLAATKPRAVIFASARPFIYDDYHILPSIEEQVEGYGQILRELTGQGIRVGVIRDNPRPVWDVPTCVLQSGADSEMCSRPRAITLESQADPLFTAAEKNAEVSALDLTRHYCTAEKCPAVIGNVLVYRDGDHLTASYAKTLAPYLDQWMQKWIHRERSPAGRAEEM